jgi:hypothetical protein
MTTMPSGQYRHHDVGHHDHYDAHHHDDGDHHVHGGHHLGHRHHHDDGHHGHGVCAQLRASVGVAGPGQSYPHSNKTRDNSPCHYVLTGCIHAYHPRKEPA